VVGRRFVSFYRRGIISPTPSRVLRPCCAVYCRSGVDAESWNDVDCGSELQQSGGPSTGARQAPGRLAIKQSTTALRRYHAAAAMETQTGGTEFSCE